MFRNKIISNFSSLKVQSSSHSIGEKYVFFNDQELQTKLKQIAFGKLKSGEIVPFHSHQSMEEVFYFLKGEGIFFIGEEEYTVKKNCCIRVPIGFSHSIPYSLA